MKTEPKTIAWKTKSGIHARIEIMFATERSINCDGHISTRPCCDLTIVGYAGNEEMGYEIDDHTDRPGYSGIIGRLLIPTAQMDAINNIIADIHATPEWEQRVANIKRSKAACEEYDAHCRKMQQVMGN